MKKQGSLHWLKLKPDADCRWLEGKISYLLSFDIYEVIQHFIGDRNYSRICLKTALGRYQFNKFVAVLQLVGELLELQQRMDPCGEFGEMEPSPLVPGVPVIGAPDSVDSVKMLPPSLFKPLRLLKLARATWARCSTCPFE